MGWGMFVEKTCPLVENIWGKYERIRAFCGSVCYGSVAKPTPNG